MKTLGSSEGSKAGPTISEPPKKKQKKQHGNKHQTSLFLPSLHIRNCDRFDSRSFERRFKSCYYQPQDPLSITSDIILSCLVLDNKICLLVLPFALKASHFQFRDELLEIVVSGKWKKGAQSVNAGGNIATVCLLDDSKETVSISLKSPIGGKILEINERLVPDTGTQLLTEENYLRDGFIAILSSEAPKNLQNHPEGKIEDFQHFNERVCFAWLKDKCQRGDQCRFEHSK